MDGINGIVMSVDEAQEVLEAMEVLTSDVERLVVELAEVRFWAAVKDDLMEAMQEELGVENWKGVVDEVRRLKANQLPDGVEWPVDEDGVRIEVGDVLQFTHGGSEWTAVGYQLDVRMSYGGEGVCTASGKTVRHVVQPEQDPWEKLEEDSRKSRCSYWGINDPVCRDCEHRGQIHCGVPLDIVRRAKELAGVE